MGRATIIFVPVSVRAAVTSSESGYRLLAHSIGPLNVYPPLTGEAMICSVPQPAESLSADAIPVTPSISPFRRGCTALSANAVSEVSRYSITIRLAHIENAVLMHADEIS